VDRSEWSVARDISGNPGIRGIPGNGENPSPRGVLWCVRPGVREEGLACFFEADGAVDAGCSRDLDGDGSSDGETDGATGDCGLSDGADPAPDRIGPDDIGGRNGMSIVSVRPSASSFDPAVIAANVGTDASPTRSTTIITYRRVGPEKPVSARYTPFRRFRMTLMGGTRSSSGCSGTAGVLPLTNDQHGSVSVTGVNDATGYRQRQQGSIRTDVTVRKPLIRTKTGTDPAAQFPDCDLPAL
jgi:hypothetical protein